MIMLYTPIDSLPTFNSRLPISLVASRARGVLTTSTFVHSSKKGGVGLVEGE